MVFWPRFGVCLDGGLVGLDLGGGVAGVWLCVWCLGFGWRRSGGVSVRSDFFFEREGVARE